MYLFSSKKKHSSLFIFIEEKRGVRQTALIFNHIEFEILYARSNDKSLLEGKLLTRNWPYIIDTNTQQTAYQQNARSFVVKSRRLLFFEIQDKFSQNRNNVAHFYPLQKLYIFYYCPEFSFSNLTMLYFRNKAMLMQLKQKTRYRQINSKATFLFFSQVS